MKKVELLAPAGSFESFLGAVHAGADAVYIGGQKYGARAYAENFTQEEVCLAIRYAHLFGKKLYLTVNTLVKEHEISELPEYIRPFYEEGLDGVIIQDMGVFALLRKCFPGLELHGSTQMTITGVRGAKFLLEQGASRVVPARELSLHEIRRIKETGIEVEAFIHGAMCYCYSGQCLFSSMLGGRSGNRGRCAQPCRLPYQVEMTASENMSVNGKRHKNREKENYPLSLKDMCTLSFIPELIEAGIDSFKIEGRMKKPEYAAGVTALYRKYIDRYYANPSADFKVEKEDMEKLRTLYIRSEIQEGYYHRHNGREMITPDKPSYLGVDEQYLKEIREQYLDNPLKLPIFGEIFLEKGKPVRLILGREIEQNKIDRISQSGQPVERAQKQPLSEDAVRKQIGKMGNTPFVLSGLQVHMEDDVFLPVKALNDLRRDALQKLEDGIVAVHQRKTPCMFEEYIANINTKTGYKVADITSDRGDGDDAKRASIPYMAVQIQKREQLVPILPKKEIGRIYVDADLLSDENSSEVKKQLVAWKNEREGRSIFLVMPVVLRLLDEAYLQRLEKELSFKTLWDGIMIRNLESLFFLKDIEWQGEILADANLYTWNRQAKEFFIGLGILPTAPLECNKNEWHELGLEETEVVVYGRSMLMVTANCVRRTEYSCRKDSSSREKSADARMLLRDRYQTEFPVRCVCGHCYNEIYNSVPLSLHDYGKSIMSEKPSGIRLAFTTETTDEVEQVLTSYEDYISMPDKKRQVSFAYTKGHYKRGAE